MSAPSILVQPKPNELTFLESQKLYRLRRGRGPREAMKAEHFRAARQEREKGGKAAPADHFWEELDRADFLANIRSGKLRRVVVTTDAGTGKSYNLRWLDYMLNQPGHPMLAFNLLIGGFGEHVSAAEFMSKALVDAILNGGNCALDTARKARVEPLLQRKRGNGQIALLFDGLDQAMPTAVGEFAKLLNNREWKACPIVVAGRPSAIERQENVELLFQGEEWEYVQVWEFDEEQQRQVLGKLKVEKTDRFDKIPKEARSILTVPRVLEYIRKLPEPDLAEIHTVSDVYWKSIGYMLTEALGSREQELTERLRALLGALAFGMYARTSKDPKGAPNPNLDRIPAAEMLDFRLDTYGRLREAFARNRRGDYPWDNPDQRPGQAGYGRNFSDDCRRLSELNAIMNHGWLDTNAVGDPTVDLLWRNASLQEFLAAYWATRWAGKEDQDQFRNWLVNPLSGDNSAFYSFWHYATEMPNLAIGTKAAWVQAMAPLYDQARVRSTEFIHRSWSRMAGTEPRQIFLAEFQELREGKRGTEKEQQLAFEMMKGFIPIPGGTFMMGAPDDETDSDDDEKPEHEVAVSAFQLHRDCVTNLEYELFDPEHKDFRWYRDPHPLAGKDGHGDDICPVVNVSWYDAWCFATWCGCELPKEEQWEYAARGGRGNRRPFYWGRKLNGTQANCDGTYPYGTKTKGQDLGYTCPGDDTNKGKYEAHPWGLRHIIGNVWEWCDDWYDEKAYNRNGNCEQTIISMYRVFRVLRGGAWSGNAWFCRAAYRFWNWPRLRYLNVGFRLCLPGPVNI